MSFFDPFIVAQPQVTTPTQKTVTPLFSEAITNLEKHSPTRTMWSPGVWQPGIFDRGTFSKAITDLEKKRK